MHASFKDELRKEIYFIGVRKPTLCFHDQKHTKYFHIANEVYIVSRGLQYS